MRYKATLVTGFATGYVLGAKAGRQRYDMIMSYARNFMEKPAIQQTAGVVQAQAADLADSAKRVVSDKVGGRSSGDVFDDGLTMDPPVYPVPTSTNTPVPTPGDMPGVTPTNGGAARH
ncbi:MAG: hypothetical protein ACR2J0_09370 [Mycobacteriales bacterium]